MSTAQIIANNLLLSLFFVYLGWTYLKPHMIANKICNDQRIIAELLSLKRAINLQNSLELCPNFRGYTPITLLDYSHVVLIKKTLSNFGYKKSISIPLVLFYFAQQDIARFRYMVAEGSKYRDLSAMTYSFNAKWIGIFTVAAVIFFLIFSQVILNLVN